MVTYTTAGESHGKSLISIVEGIPAGVEISTSLIEEALMKRRGGIGRGERQKFEQDVVTILSGAIHGVTIGSPIAIQIENSEWSKWDKIMSVDSVAGGSPEGLEAQLQPNVPDSEVNDKLVKPRPGHTDLEAIRKYGFADARPALERSSARETAARVAAGAVANAFLAGAFPKLTISGSVQQFGSIKRSDFVDDEDFETAARAFAQNAVEQGETVGGIIEITVDNPPYGLGSYVSASTRLDSALAAALISIQAFKGVEIGDGFELASVPGSQAHDQIVTLTVDDEDGTAHTQIIRTTNHAGGIEGGISNGMPIILRAVVKPIPSIPGGLPTINVASGEATTAHSQRSDVSAVCPAVEVAKAMAALTLADFVTRKFGADTLNEVIRNHESFVDSVPEHLR